MEGRLRPIHSSMYVKRSPSLRMSDGGATPKMDTVFVSSTRCVSQEAHFFMTFYVICCIAFSWVVRLRSFAQKHHCFMSRPSDELNWDRVLTYEYWDSPSVINSPGYKEEFLNGRAQKVAAGLYGDTLILVLGNRVKDHSGLLDLGYRHFKEQGESFPDDSEWAGGAFIEYYNEENKLNIWGDSTTLDGPLTPEIEKIALEVFADLEYL